MKFINRHKKLFIFSLSLISFIIALISISPKYKPTFVNNALGVIITPVQGVFTNVGDWFSGKIDFVVNMADMESENNRFKKELEELTTENSRLNIVDKENQKLTELLEIQRKYSSYPITGANVIAKDVGSWYNTFIIDKGTKDDLKKDMVVLASGGLVGRIYEVGYNYSKVRSIIDDKSSVSSKSERTDDIGYLRGDPYLMLDGQCRMDFIDSQAEMLEGDMIITSHLSKTYPPGLVIGKVIEIVNEYNGTKYALVELFVDFKHLETVLVVTQVFEQELIEDTVVLE